MHAMVRSSNFFDFETFTNFEDRRYAVAVGGQLRCLDIEPDGLR